MDEPTYVEEKGVVLMLDALGTKGVWKNRDPKQVLENWDMLMNAFDIQLKKMETKFSIKTELNAFSDTIIITFSGKLDDCLFVSGAISRVLILTGLIFNIFLRGCISVGNFYNSKRMILGPAIDEAAQYYEQSDWIGVFTTPSAYSVLRRIISYTDNNLDSFFLEYGVPMKNSVEKNWALILELEWGDSFGQLVKGKDVIEHVHELMEDSNNIGDGKKWKNTLDFLYFLKNETK